MNTLDIQRHIADRLAGRQHLLVAFSGGLDSTVLLHALVQLRASRLPHLRLRVVHVHHGLSHFADQWVDHCESVCYLWQVPLHVLHVQVDTQRNSVEAAARDARYRGIAELIDSHETLLTAQHLDDQCETFLLALKRGSGPTGLSAMAQSMPFFACEQLRPLLDISREQLTAYAQAHHLSWVEDDSNTDARFDRNFLRMRIVPLLRERWPHFSEAVARSASLCAEQEQLLDELLMESLQALMSEDDALSIDGLLPLSEAKRYALLRRWIACFGVMMPTREQLQRLWHEVALAREDAEPQLHLAKCQVRRFRRRLYLLPPLRSLRDEVLRWDPRQPLTLPDGLGELQLGSRGVSVRAPAPDEAVTIRFCAQGVLRIVGRRHSRAIKKIWQELHIPPWERERTPMLYYGERLIAALGVFVTQEGQATAGATAWNIHWSKDWM
ncbi:tRNA lysidine(34) synthetase TilS [Edwardsiella piscicida]|uniref:tRNA(Ile)-lysidine synthase n=3 Tax=Edwardsiella TaxID=635 RepID=A0A0H3DNK9_EDWTF|nr:tRNA lysidine(34) synthetase TilS [Edwardsiella piscicida]ACY83604.1 tRNA(Ile)-lysidine synthetase [Edwardsiella tarda EIB202]ADM40824.1 tRNA(Ile)-lysidine synthetase [Edwardsiella tarda FL6-60]AGH72866.1 tRNA(Ile)-lysidine ligase [Edwardsiella piscicida C07-087]ARD17612.1 tRNA(Ile)-lysidine synthetase [Edwardsiella piscicida]EKS7765554.1 tRNA lysidine(34) synthetase TilS [Edwardsiella piscicida]